MCSVARALALKHGILAISTPARLEALRDLPEYDEHMIENQIKAHRIMMDAIRDVLAGRPTLLMSRELYAVPVLLGCIVFVVLLTYFPDYRFVGSIGCILLIFGLRAAAIHWKLTVPLWSTTKPTAK